MVALGYLTSSPDSMPKTFWLCLCVGGIGIQVDWSRFYISSLPPHHRQQHLHHPYPGPPSLLCHSHFQRCLVSLTPVMVPLPFSMVQERRREAPAHHHRVPRGPSLACSSCCSIQLLLSIRLRPAGLGNSVRAEPLWLRASHLLRCLFVGSTTETAAPSPAAQPLRSCWQDLIMAEAPQAQVFVPFLLLFLLSLAPAAVLGGCPSSCRCSFAMLQCVEADKITSIPALSPQESENVTEMWVWQIPVFSVNRCLSDRDQSCCWTFLEHLSLCFLVSWHSKDNGAF